MIDTKELARWCNGLSRIQPEHRDLIGPIVQILADVVLEAEWLPRYTTGDWVTWRKRDLNTEADALANLAMDHKQSFIYATKRLLRRVTCMTWRYKVGAMESIAVKAGRRRELW